jgi:hypothetical protein
LPRARTRPQRVAATRRRLSSGRTLRQLGTPPPRAESSNAAATRRELERRRHASESTRAELARSRHEPPDPIEVVGAVSVVAGDGVCGVSDGGRQRLRRLWRCRQHLRPCSAGGRRLLPSEGREEHGNERREWRGREGGGGGLGVGGPTRLRCCGANPAGLR